MSISKIVNNSLDSSVSLGVKVATINVANSTYVTKDDTAVDTAGGYIVISGAGFASGAQVMIGNVTACSTTFVSTTQLQAQVPAQSAGTYTVYVVNSDGGVGMKINGLTYSGLPTWVTASALANQVGNVAFTGNFSATDAVSYQLTTGSSFPTGMSLANTANGYYVGNVSVAADTTYNFSIDAIDAQSQESARSFSLFIRKLLYNQTLDVLGDGTCLALYQFENNSNDTGGNYNPSSIRLGSPVYSSSVKPFNSYSLNSTNKDVSWNLPTIRNSYPLSVSAWVYQTNYSTSSENRMVMNFSIGGQRLSINIPDFYSDNGYRPGIMYGGTNHWLFGSSQNIPLNTWTHIVWTVVGSNDSGHAVYKNGSALSATNAGGGHGGSAGAVLCGSIEDERYRGYIKNVRVYNKALSSAEALLIYNRENGS